MPDTESCKKEKKMEQEMNNRSIGKKATLTFFIIVILLSAVVETLICRGGPE